MPAKRGLTMRQIRDLLRLSHEGCSVRDLVLRYGVARSTIQDNLKRAKDAGLTWPLPADLTDDFLQKPCFPTKAARRVIGVARSRIGRYWRASSSGRASRCRCFGRNIGRFIRRATVTLVMLRPGLCGASREEAGLP